ncbi:hypothetical protein [Streptomyces sp. SID10815]|uniref:hypothetical protein n=1 Tax=Streptomyces sp. SID10815 TaxID=2706027 RepID=UPI0013C6A3C3|nr:hypothetical protein [Streptomyces sp. SID10815]
MVRRPVAWVVAVVLFVEALGVAALNWILGEVVHRQRMSLAGTDPDVVSTSSKVAALVFGLYFAVCGLVALLVAIRGRRPAGFGRILLISAAVVHGLLAALVVGPVGWKAFVFLIVVLALIVLLLMTYDPVEAPAGAGPGGTGPQDAGPGGTPAEGGRSEDGRSGGGRPQGGGPAAGPVVPPAGAS